MTRLASIALAAEEMAAVSEPVIAHGEATCICFSQYVKAANALFQQADSHLKS
ncbi:hypothetical protein [Vreelandella titanicae]|uniref:hypothetical protein n=1 Tax=Vreelandella titanicae TaxID=664683 RepID=UPI0039BF48BA